MHPLLSLGFVLAMKIKIFHLSVSITLNMQGQTLRSKYNSKDQDHENIFCISSKIRRKIIVIYVNVKDSLRHKACHFETH